jgi:dihydroxy-acid dehydratase
MASASGRRIVEMVGEGLKPSAILSRAAFENAIVVAMAMGCSTNAVIHLIAMARRAGHDIGLDDFERASRRIPVLANVRPSGERYLMEDFFYAGGILALLKRLTGLLHHDPLTVSGRPIGEVFADAAWWNDDVIRPLDKPVSTEPAMAVLYGNLAPNGCVMKPSAADPRLLNHAGPALVFDSYAEMKARIDDDDIDATADTVLVMRGAGPLGGPGMPEWGMLPIPKKLLRAGVRDMLRVSDARMSGTSYGACVLHVSPEAHVGGPLALARTGDVIKVDVEARRIDMQVSDAELAARRATLKRPEARFERGYGWMFSQHITQAHEGCDFDFLQAGFGRSPGEPAIL